MRMASPERTNITEKYSSMHDFQNDAIIFFRL
jgi:hypothetical protein